MSRFAKGTTVTREKSIAEIERIITRYGASSFAYGWQGDAATVMFEAVGRRIRFLVPMPSRNDQTFTHYRHGKGVLVERSAAVAAIAWEQACRQRWRALALVIKAKLEAVDAKITTFEEEFLSHIVLPNGKSVSDFMLPQISRAYETGKMPPMLSGPAP